jgi:hypothetical protein
MKRFSYLIIGGIASAVSVWFVWAILRDKQLQKGFDEIAAEATEQEVVKYLGHPKRVEKCGEFFGPLEKKEMEGCAREFFYASPFAPVLPQYYVVRFDANNHVKGKTPYTSP